MQVVLNFTICIFIKSKIFIKVKRRGAVEARRAHNPDVLGSKPSGAKLNFYIFIVSPYENSRSVCLNIEHFINGSTLIRLY